MKKTIVLLTLALLLLAGCDQIGIDIEDGGTPGAESPQETPMITPDASESPGDGQSSGQGADVGELTEEDFTVTVEGVSFTIGTDPAEVIDTFGDGGADEDNNFGFIGWDDTETYKYFRHDYEGFSIVGKTHVKEATSEISQIGLTDAITSRDVGPGDSYESMLLQYGEPDEEKSDEGMIDCFYRSGERTLIFVLGEADKQIGYIEIR